MSDGAKVSFGTMVLVVLGAAYIAGGGCYLYGREVGIDKERNHRADPKSYPPGACSQQIAACNSISGTMRINTSPFRREDDMPRCEKTVEVHP